MYTSFGDRLLLFRKKLKLDQEQFAEKLGIPVKELASYEGDAAYPPLNTTIKMADALNISLDFLSCHIDEPVEALFLKRIVGIQNMGSKHLDTTIYFLNVMIWNDKHIKIEKESS